MEPVVIPAVVLATIRPNCYQPVGGMTPATQAELAAEALAAGTSADDLGAALDDYAARRTTS